MRLLPSSQQRAVLGAACNFIRFHTHFRVEDSDPQAPCGSSVRIITGEEEGLFGWIAVNYLMDQFARDDDDHATYGFLDMGGASTQIAFEPSAEEQEKTNGLIDVRLRLIGGEEIVHHVFVTTWLGYGTNQARERYVGETASRYEASLDVSDASTHGPIPDPCLPRDLTLTEASVPLSHENIHDIKTHTLTGTGSYEMCLKQVGPLLNKEAPCPDSPCLFNGVHVPHIDFSVSHFIGVSEYWYSSEHVFGLGGPYNFVEFERAAADFCSRSWSEILRRHEFSKLKSALGGDGEVEEDGKIVGLGKWGDKVEISRLQMQCFKSAWLVNVLHDGIGMPRIVDPGGNSTGQPNEVQDKASQKGLGKPILQSLDAVGDTAISWTLGKMVLEASREIPPLSKDVPPLSDPVAGEIIDQNGIDSSDQRFPSHILDQYQLNFTFLGLSLYLTSIIVLFIIAYRLRHSVSNLFRRYFRKTFRGKSADNEYYTPLENGYHLSVERDKAVSLSLPIPSFASRHLAHMRSLGSRFLTLVHVRQLTPPSTTVTSEHHMPSLSPRAAPTRSFSSPALRNQNGSAVNNQYANTYAGSSLPSRSTTPPLYRRDQTQLVGHASQSLQSLSRSRNSSHLNLTTLVPRQAISRGGSSGQQTPTGVFHDGD